MEVRFCLHPKNLVSRVLPHVQPAFDAFAGSAPSFAFLRRSESQATIFWLLLPLGSNNRDFPPFFHQGNWVPRSSSPSVTTVEVVCVTASYSISSETLILVFFC